MENYIRPDFYLKNSPRTLDIGQTSRGCPFKCGFCSSAGIRRRKWRAMSSERSVALIEEAVRRFNLNGIWIRDDEFHVDRTRTSEICEGILEKNLNISWYTAGTRVDLFNRASDEEIGLLRRSGAYALKFGVESGSNRILELIEKGVTWQEALEANRKASKHGIVFGFSLMMGFPTETMEEIHRTVDLARQIKSRQPWLAARDDRHLHTARWHALVRSGSRARPRTAGQPGRMDRLGLLGVRPRRTRESPGSAFGTGSGSET